MFDVTTKAEVRHINVRSEAHGDEIVPAIDVQLMLLGVPCDRITSAVPDMAKRFYKGEQVAVGEINPFVVHHKLENLAVKIGKVTLTGVDIKKNMKVHLLPGKVANVLVSVQAEHEPASTADLIAMLRDEVDVSINERQLKIAEMEQ